MIVHDKVMYSDLLKKYDNDQDKISEELRSRMNALINK